MPTPQEVPTKQGDTRRKPVTKRGGYEILRAQLDNERASFHSHWQELGSYILPRRPRFTVTDGNRGDRRNQKIIDNTASLAARTLRSGMMGGITSPARPWFRLSTAEEDLNDVLEVKDWLGTVTKRMNDVFLRSNLYNALPIIYGDMGTFGTSALMVEEDEDDVMRFYPFAIGSYMIANDSKLKVKVFYREFQMTVAQLLEKFGKKDSSGNWIWDNFSLTVKNLWIDNQDQAWIQVAHVIMPNDKYDGSKMNPKFKKYKSCYYERGQGQGKNNYLSDEFSDVLLRESGYDFFPVLCPRWEINGEDVYGTSCPGMDALGDVKALQLMHKRKAQAIEKMVNPAMTGPSSLRASKASILPGDITYVDTREGQQGFRPAHEVRPEVDKLLLDIEAHQQRIRRAFFEDLFLMLASDPRQQPPTAREVDERHEEKLLALGPVLEQLNQDLLDPLIDIAFDLMLRHNLIPEPPQQLQGIVLRVEYVSVMAQAQKLVDIAALERFAQFVQQLVSEAGDPSILDKVDFDELIDQYADRVSAPPHVVRSDKDVALIRRGRAQMQQQKQAQETMQSMTDSAKTLSDTNTGGQNALTDILKQAQAGNVVPQ